MPVVVHRLQPEMTTPQALAQQAQGLYARAASLLHGIAEEDEVESPRSYAGSISTCSSKEVLGQGKLAIGKAVMFDGKPPSKVGLCDAVFAANLTAAEKDDRLESLQSRMLNADNEMSALREQLRASETLQATQRTGFELQIATGDTKLREAQARCAALEAHQAVESVSSREACREEIAQALSGLRESHKRECEKASHLLNVANGEAQEEALLVKYLRTEAIEQTARWGEDRETLLGESHQLQASLQECNNRLAGLEVQVQHASESASRSATERVGEVEALALARAESSRVSLHAEAIEQEWRNDAEAHNATKALVEVELRGFEERIAAIQHEADQACTQAKAEARAEAAEAAEAVAKLRTIEQERAEDVEAAFRMHADARQALEHLCHFVGRRQLGEDDAQAIASAEVAAASAEAAGLREELHHHFHAQHDLRQELSALSSAAAAVHSATEAKDEIIMRLQSKVSELSLQQMATSSEHREEGLPAGLQVPTPQFSEQLESSGVPPAQQRTDPEPDLAVTDLWRARQAPPSLERQAFEIPVDLPQASPQATELTIVDLPQASELTDGDTPSVNNLGTWRSDVLTSSAGSVELKRSNSKPLIESSGTPEGAPPDTPQLGTRELPDSNLSSVTTSAAVTQLQQQLACCLPGEDALPSAVAAAAVTAVKAALASLSEDNASKLLQNGDAQEVRLRDNKAPSIGLCSTGSSLGAFDSPAAVPFAAKIAQEQPVYEEYEGFAQQQRSMTEDLKSDISRLRRILFEKSSAFLQLEEDAKKLLDGNKDPRVASPNGQRIYPKTPEVVRDPRVSSPNGQRSFPSVPKSPDVLSAPSFVAPNINQFGQSRLAEVLHSKQDAMPPIWRVPTVRQQSGETTPKTRDRTVSPHPRNRTGSMHSMVSDNQPPHPVPHPIPHRRGLVERLPPQTSNEHLLKMPPGPLSRCESLDTCTPLCRSQQTLPPDPFLDQTPSTPGVIEQSIITVNQEATPSLEPRMRVAEIAAAWDRRAADLAKQVEAKGSATISNSTRPRTPSPLRHGSPTPVPLRTIQASGKITARSIDAPQASTPGAPTPPAPITVAQSGTPSLQPRYTTPPPGRLTPTSGNQPVVQPPGSLPIRPQSHWQQRVNAACSIQTLEQTLQTLKLRAQAPASAQALGIGEASGMKPSMSSASLVDPASRSATPTPHASASMPSLLPQKAGEKSSGSMVVTRQKSPLSSGAVPAPQAMISGSSDGLRQVLRVASPLPKKPMAERDCSPTRLPVSGVQQLEAKRARTPGRFTATPRVAPPAGGAQSVSPQPQRLTAPTTPPVGSGSVMLQRSRVCWPPSSHSNP